MPTASTARWINTQTYPHTLDHTAYFLGDGGALTPTSPAAGATESLTWGPGSTISFTVSAPFAEDMTLIGPSALRVWASSSNANLQLFAQLIDVAPNGMSTEITHGSVLGSRFATDPARSWPAANGLPAQPHLLLDRDLPLTPGAVIMLDVPLQPAAWRLPAGHSLRLVLSTQAAPEACSGFLGKPAGCLYSAPMAATLPGGTYSILRGGDHPSVVNVPLVPSSQLVTARSGATPTSGGVVLPLDWGTAALSDQQPAGGDSGAAAGGTTALGTSAASLPATGGPSLGMAGMLAGAAAVVGLTVRRRARA